MILKSITIHKNVLIDNGLLKHYFEGKVPTNIRRAIKKISGNQVLEFVEKSFMHSSGRLRVADIHI